MSMTIEQAKVHASAEYGFPVGIVEVDDIPYAEYHDHLRPATHWGGRPPDRPHVDYNAPERLVPPGPPPSFKDALNRMTEAYRKLFELEQRLRIFIHHHLEERYGTAWWDKVHPNARAQVEGREKDPLKLLFDDYSPTRLALSDFDGLRLTVIENWEDFKDVLGNQELFQSQMIWLSRARNRIAHVNTLSADDVQDFMAQANRLLILFADRAPLQ